MTFVMKMMRLGQPGADSGDAQTQAHQDQRAPGSLSRFFRAALLPFDCAMGFPVGSPMNKRTGYFKNPWNQSYSTIAKGHFPMAHVCDFRYPLPPEA